MLTKLDGLATFNLVESLVWFSFGTALLVAALFRPPGFRYGIVAGLAFLAFGASDLVEMQTGAWFRPWWLLLWKATCVTVLVGTFARYRLWLRALQPSPRPP